MKISEQQFNFVYTEYSKELYNIAYGYTKNKDDSIDITQNVFVKLLEITDFSDNKYIFQKKYGEDGSYTLIYNKMEKIYIPKEVFTSSTGYFYIATIQFNLCNDGWIDSIEIYTRIKYELFEENKVKLLVVDRFE